VNLLINGYGHFYSRRTSGHSKTILHKEYGFNPGVARQLRQGIPRYFASAGASLRQAWQQKPCDTDMGCARIGFAKPRRGNSACESGAHVLRMYASAWQRTFLKPLLIKRTPAMGTKRTFAVSEDVRARPRAARARISASRYHACAWQLLSLFI
jgi:hypothetical protein